MGKDADEGRKRTHTTEDIVRFQGNSSTMMRRCKKLGCTRFGSATTPHNTRPPPNAPPARPHHAPRQKRTRPREEKARRDWMITQAEIDVRDSTAGLGVCVMVIDEQQNAPRTTEGWLQSRRRGKTSRAVWRMAGFLRREGKRGRRTEEAVGKPACLFLRLGGQGRQLKAAHEGGQSRNAHTIDSRMPGD